MRLAIWGAVLTIMATGAAAQTQYGPPANTPRAPGIYGGDAGARQPTVGREVEDVRTQIRKGRSSGTLTKRDGRRLRREASQIDTLSDRYGADGMSDSERTELDNRARVLRDVTNGQRLQGSAKPR